MKRDLTRIGERARKYPKEQFTSIYHFITDPENLRASFKALKNCKATGIDGVSKSEYGENLEANLVSLTKRLGNQGYHPRPAKRKYIPKPGSKKKRPLGIPCVEEKLVEMATKRVLEQIYEHDFENCSFGYRPGRSCHQALDLLGRTIQQKKVSYIVEADIKGFFDHVNHDWLMEFLRLRIADQRVLRLIGRMLKGGIMEDGLTKVGDEGTPQGGVLSPLLSNIYLHYALDLWFVRRFRRQCKGEAYYFRYADDFLACFQYMSDAENFRRALVPRLGKFQLELEPSKTKQIKFGRFAEKNAQEKGRKPAQFDFLGFSHYCGKTRYGCFKVKRRTSKKKFRAKLKQEKEWLKKNRSWMKRGQILIHARQVYVGHIQYYAITDNWEMCSSFGREYVRLLYKWLNRESQRRSYRWSNFNDALKWVRWPSVRIKHKIDPFKKLTLKDC